MKIHLSHVFISLILLASCGGSKTAQEADASHTNDLIVTRFDDETLNDLLRSAKFYLESKLIDKFIELCDPENYHIQRDMGIDDHQYVIEILNLKTLATHEGNYLSQIEASLDALSTVTYTTMDVVKNNYETGYDVRGMINYTNDRSSTFYLMVRKRGDLLLITGGVG